MTAIPGAGPSRRELGLGALGALAAGPALAQATAQRRTYAFEGGARSTSWRPFDFWRRTAIFLTGSVNGLRTEMFVDSGAAFSVMDRATAA